MFPRALAIAWMLRVEGAAALLLGGWLLLPLIQGGDAARTSGGACTGPLAGVLGPVFTALLGLTGTGLALVGAASLAAGGALLRHKAAAATRLLLWIFAFGWALAAAFAALRAAAPQNDLEPGLLVAGLAAAVSLLHVSATQGSQVVGPAHAAHHSSAA